MPGLRLDADEHRLPVGVGVLQRGGKLEAVRGHDPVVPCGGHDERRRIVHARAHGVQG